MGYSAGMYLIAFCAASTMAMSLLAAAWGELSARITASSVRFVPLLSQVYIMPLASPLGSSSRSYFPYSSSHSIMTATAHTHLSDTFSEFLSQSSPSAAGALSFPLTTVLSLMIKRLQ